MSDILPQDNTPRKQCTGPCGRFLPATLDYFHAAKKGKYGLTAKCKDCRLAYQSTPERREQKQAYDKVYRSQPEVQERNHTYQGTYRTNPEKRPHLLAQKKVYYIQTHENAFSLQRFPDKRTRMKAYRSRPEIQERTRSQTLTHLARKRAVTGSHTASQIQEQLKRQRYRCYYCSTHFQKAKGKHVFHIDHTFPISRVVGTNIPANSIDYLVLACPTCNMRKGDKFPWEWPEGGRLL